MATPAQYTTSWLCPEPGDRERLLDMDRRLRRARMVAMGLIGLALVLVAPWVGWWTLALLAGIGIAFHAIDRRIPRSPRPELLIAASWVASVIAIAVSVVLTGGADSPAKSWLLIPAITLPARFHRRGLVAGIALTMVALAVVTVGVDPERVAEQPDLFLFPAALIAASMALSMALRSAEIQHRAESVIDPLTGMLNRKALEARTAELEQQSRVGQRPVGLIVCDIDHFKQVNDRHGHAAGDAVLAEVAYRLRKELRAYDLAYRLGGEEFVVLVPGASPASARGLAERLRAAVAAEPVDGVGVTASFGVAASGSGPLSFHDLFAAADEALYRAKASGRDCVRAPDEAAFAALARSSAAPRSPAAP